MGDFFAVEEAGFDYDDFSISYPAPKEVGEFLKTAVRGAPRIAPLSALFLQQRRYAPEHILVASSSLSIKAEEHAETNLISPSFMPAERAAEGKAGTPPFKGNQDLGGIDLNPANLNLEVRGKGIELKEFVVPFDIKNFEGFTFRILKIEPLKDLKSVFNPSQKSPGFNPGMLTQKGRSLASLRGGNAVVVSPYGEASHSAREEAPDLPPSAASPESFTPTATTQSGKLPKEDITAPTATLKEEEKQLTYLPH
jgi:hypothetical protein